MSMRNGTETDSVTMEYSIILIETYTRPIQRSDVISNDLE